MKVLGIIAEYNPFHNGHKLHISRAIKQIQPDALVAVISGNFVQRGEPSIIDKHSRAEAALENGIDLVLELPSLFSSASAEYFAFGGVSLLNATGVVSHISFGCETESFETLKLAADELYSESQEFSSEIKKLLLSGLSYPKARISALEKVLKITTSNILSSPNNILAVEYLKALQRLESNIIPVPIFREGASYDSKELSGTISSAAAIREKIYKSGASGLFEIEHTMPESSFEILKNRVVNGLTPDFDKTSYSIISFFRNSSPDDLRKLPYMSEGLEYRIIRAAEKSTDLKTFFHLCNSSRYPDSRIRRITSCVLTGATEKNLADAKKFGCPYIKALAFNKKGASLLKSMKKKTALPIITKPSILKNLTGFALDTANIEARATDSYFLCLNSPRPSGMEYTTTPLYREQ